MSSTRVPILQKASRIMRHAAPVVAAMIVAAMIVATMIVAAMIVA